MTASLILTVMSGAAGFVTAGRLLFLRWRSRLPWFLASVLAGAVQGFLPWIAGDPSTRGYADVWALTVPIVLALRAAAVAEAWGALMHSYAAAARLSRRFTASFLASGILVSLASGFDTLRPVHGWRGVIFLSISEAMRYFGSVAGFFTLLALGWALCVSPRERWIVRHLSLLAAYHLTTAAAYLALNMGVSWEIATVGLTASSIAWYALWAVSFNAAPGFERSRAHLSAGADATARRAP